MRLATFPVDFHYPLDFQQLLDCFLGIKNTLIAGSDGGVDDLINKVSQFIG
jgi:hypothetical protein